MPVLTELDTPSSERTGLVVQLSYRPQHGHGYDFGAAFEGTRLRAASTRDTVDEDLCDAPGHKALMPGVTRALCPVSRVENEGTREICAIRLVRQELDVC